MVSMGFARTHVLTLLDQDHQNGDHVLNIEQALDLIQPENHQF
jgi:hypothetical protein